VTGANRVALGIRQQAQQTIVPGGKRGRGRDVGDRCDGRGEVEVGVRVGMEVGV
jgi:hypothetical protein